MSAVACVVVALLVLFAGYWYYKQHARQPSTFEETGSVNPSETLATVNLVNNDSTKDSASFAVVNEIALGMDGCVADDLNEFEEDQTYQNSDAEALKLDTATEFRDRRLPSLPTSKRPDLSVKNTKVIVPSKTKSLH